MGKLNTRLQEQDEFLLAYYNLEIFSCLNINLVVLDAFTFQIKATTICRGAFTHLFKGTRGHKQK